MKIKKIDHAEASVQWNKQHGWHITLPVWAGVDRYRGTVIVPFGGSTKDKQLQCRVRQICAQMNTEKAR